MGAWLLCGIGDSAGVLMSARLLCGLGVFDVGLMGARLLSLRVFVGVLRCGYVSWSCALVFVFPVVVRTSGDVLVDG